MKKLLFVLCIVLFSLGCDNSKANKIYQQAQQKEKIFDYVEAIKEYEKISHNFQNTEVAPLAIAQIAHCQQEIEKRENLVEESKTLIQDKQFKVAINKLQELQKMGIKEQEKPIIHKLLEDYKSMFIQDTFTRSEEMAKSENYEEAVNILNQLEEISILENVKIKQQNKIHSYKELQCQSWIEQADELYNGKNKKGKKVKKDLASAFNLYQKAALYGNAYSQYSCGRMYEFGKGIGQDWEKALEYYEMAEKQEYENAKKRASRLRELVKLDNLTSTRKQVWLWSWLGATQNEVYKKYGHIPTNISNTPEGHSCLVYGNKLITVPGAWGLDRVIGQGHFVSFCFKNLNGKKEKRVYLVTEGFANRAGYNDYPTLDSKLPKVFEQIPKQFTKVNIGYSDTVKQYWVGNEEWKFQYFKGIKPSFDVNSGTYKNKQRNYVKLIQVELKS